MAINTKFSIYLPALFEQPKSQFSDLDPKDPSAWPAFPRYLTFVCAAAAVVIVAWFAWLTDFQAELEQEVLTEEKLKTDFSANLTKAVNLDALKKQR